ncbi:MAG: pyrimidine/purine nucleoside phosphorylase [Candidatus Margulisiibacteriota bacterium]
MVKVNEYFNGKVKSLTLNNKAGKQSIGVMEPGEYEFGTSSHELMHVVSGALNVMLPDSQHWQVFEAGSLFQVPANSRFQVRVAEEAAYLCEYL